MFQQFFRPAEVLSHRIEQRQAASYVCINAQLAVLDLSGFDQSAVDVVTLDGLHVARVGDDTQAVVAQGSRLRRRGDLVGLDEPHAGGPVGGEEEPQEALAVAVFSADDLLLALVPFVDLHELVDHGLHFVEEPLVGVASLLGGRTIRVPTADDVADTVLVPIDGEFVRHGQRAALGADLGQLPFIGEGGTGAATAGTAAGKL